MPTAAYRRQPQPRRRLYAGLPSGASAAFPARPDPEHGSHLL